MGYRILSQEGRAKSGAYQGRNRGRRGVAGERRREGCPLAFACEARPSRTGGGLNRPLSWPQREFCSRLNGSGRSRLSVQEPQEYQGQSPWLDRSLRYWNNAQVYRFAWSAPISSSSRASLWPSSQIPKKKTSSPIVKEKWKAGTRAGLTKAAIVAAAAKLIESVGANGFSLRKLAKALGVGPTAIHFHFEGGVGSVFGAVAQQALAGVTGRTSRRRSPPLTLANCSSKSSRRCTLDHPLLAERWLWPRSACRRRPVQECFGGRWARVRPLWMGSIVGNDEFRRQRHRRAAF